MKELADFVSEDEICALFGKLSITETQNFDEKNASQTPTRKTSKQLYATSLITSTPLSHDTHHENLYFHSLILARYRRRSYEHELKQKSDEIQDLKSENQDLRERLDKEMANGEVLDMNLKDMCWERANLIDRAYNEVEWLRAQFEAEKDQIIRSYELELKQKSDDIEDLKASQKSESVKAQVGKLKSQKDSRVSSLKKDLEALRAQLECSIRRISDLHLSLNKLKRAQKLQLKEKSDQIEELKASEKAKKTRVKHLEAEIKMLNESIDCSTSKQDEIEAELEEVSWGKADLERVMTERAINELENQRAQFEAKLALLSSRQQVEIMTIMIEFENEKKQMEEQFKEANKTSQNISEQLNSLKALMKSNEEELEKRFQDLKHVENEKSGLESKIEKLEARLSQVESEKAISEAKLLADREEALEKEKLKNNKNLADLRHEHTIEVDRIKYVYEKRLNDANALTEKLHNSQIDVNRLNDKLTETLKYYRASIEKLQLASRANMQFKEEKKRKRDQFEDDMLDEKLFFKQQSSQSVDVVNSRLKSFITVRF